MEKFNNNELSALSFEQLAIKLDEIRRDLLELRLKVATSHVKSFSSDQIKLKRAIARVLTHMRFKQMATI